MREGIRIRIHQSQHVSNALAVICAQSGAVCPEDIAFQDQLQAVLGKVMVRVTVLLVYHIHMSLQQQCRQMLITRCGRLLDYHIVALVDTGIQTQLGSGVCDECRDCLFIIRTMRDRRNILEILQRQLRLLVCENVVHVVFSPL